MMRLLLTAVALSALLCIPIGAFAQDTAVAGAVEQPQDPEAQKPDCPEDAEGRPDKGDKKAKEEESPLQPHQDLNGDGIDDRCEGQPQQQPVQPTDPAPQPEQPVEEPVEQPQESDEPQESVDQEADPQDDPELVEPFTINVLRADAPVLAPKQIAVRRGLGKFKAGEKAASFAKNDVQDGRFFPWISNGLLAATVLMPLVLGLLILRLGLRSTDDQAADVPVDRSPRPRRSPRPPRLR